MNSTAASRSCGVLDRQWATVSSGSVERPTEKALRFSRHSAAGSMVAILHDSGAGLKAPVSRPLPLAPKAGVGGLAQDRALGVGELSVVRAGPGKRHEPVRY